MSAFYLCLYLGMRGRRDGGTLCISSIPYSSLSLGWRKTEGKEEEESGETREESAEDRQGCSERWGAEGK